MTLTEANSPELELYELISLFYDDPQRLGKFEPTSSEKCPPEYRRLLGHSSHMTVTVEQRHAQTVDVDVLTHSTTQDFYQRKIVLRRRSDRSIVQFGIVRIRLDALTREVRNHVLARQIPLGRILIEHNILRQIQLIDLWRVECGPDLATLFDVEPHTVTYGRTARIFLNTSPAIDLLEIVAVEPDESATPQRSPLR